jgi:hyaluronan synthase
MRALYVGLFGLTFASGGLFLAYYARGEALWLDFAAGYLITFVAYTLWLFALLFRHDLRPHRYGRYGGQKIAVVVPCFNEEPALVERSLRSLVAAVGNKQIVVVDDGSTNGVQCRLRDLAPELGFVLHEFRANAGKREALHHAVTRLLDEDAEFVVTIDSDTVLDRHALVRVVEPLLDPRIGASTGDVRLLNEAQNLLTRMIGTYYWIGLNMYKQAQSVIRSVVCCSGCLAAYRAGLMRSIVGELVEQRFLGERCTHSEDRHLTNLVLKRGLDVVYVPEAISWTETPATLRSFVRQQRRWKRGYIRESLFTLTYAWRTKRLLWLQVLCWDLTAPFLSLGLRLALIAMAIQDPGLLFTVVLPSWIALMLVRYIFVPLRAWRKLPGLFLYMLFYECCLYWLSLWALVTVKNRSWVTRVGDRQATATVF